MNSRKTQPPAEESAQVGRHDGGSDRARVHTGQKGLAGYNFPDDLGQKTRKQSKPDCTRLSGIFDRFGRHHGIEFITMCARIQRTEP